MPDILLKANTAQIVTVGPFYDKTDDVTIENSLTITNEKITMVLYNNETSYRSIDTIFINAGVVCIHKRELLHTTVKEK